MENKILALIENRRCICIVGAGGKTSLMLYLAQLCAMQGKRTAVITSTRIRRTDAFCRTAQECQSRWQEGAYAVCGTQAENGKLAMPEPDVLGWLHAHADVLLCEADGARGMACKAPDDHEPVILPECDLVIGVMGLDVLGSAVCEVCHRPELVCRLLACGDTHCLTENDMANILLSGQGTKKHVGGRAYAVVLNKCDDAPRLAAGMRIARLLAGQGQRDVLLTKLREGRIVWIQGD